MSWLENGFPPFGFCSDLFRRLQKMRTTESSGNCTGYKVKIKNKKVMITAPGGEKHFPVKSPVQSSKRGGHS